MSKNTIKIDGEKLKRLLESATGKTVREIAIENGFSKNLISEAIRVGRASPIVQNVARLYEIYPADYMLIEEEETAPDPEPDQLSIDDISLNISRSELKKIIRETIVETLDGLITDSIYSEYDPRTRDFTLKIHIKEV